ncbi:PadR family transcriptional regulator [Chloroflexota bacterium]
MFDKHKFGGSPWKDHMFRNFMNMNEDNPMSNMPKFFQGLWRKRSFQKGDLKYVVLELIKDKPRYGYEIIRALEERSHGFYSPSPGTVYPTLQMLEEMGYVSSEERDSRKVYTITTEGLDFLKEQGDFTDEIKSQMKDRWDQKDTIKIREIMGAFIGLGRLIISQADRVDADKMKRIQDVFSRTYTEIESIIKE